MIIREQRRLSCFPKFGPQLGALLQMLFGICHLMVICWFLMGRTRLSVNGACYLDRSRLTTTWSPDTIHIHHCYSRRSQIGNLRLKIETHLTPGF